jgi:hypothetical protein
VQAGLAPGDADFPRRESWQFTVLPAAFFGSIAFVVLIVALAISHPLLAAVSGIVLGGSVVLGVAGNQYLLADPLRLNTRERKELAGSRTWESHEVWTTASSGPERALVNLAIAAAQRIATSPAWRSPYLDEHRIRLALNFELDEIDAQARQIAVARSARPGDPVAEQAWSASVDRVAALRRYAEQLEVLSSQLGLPALRGLADRSSGQLLQGSVQDQYATERTHELTAELGQDLAGTTASIGQTLAVLRPMGSVQRY